METIEAKAQKFLQFRKAKERKKAVYAAGKCCLSCAKWQPMDNFHKNVSAFDGHTTCCKRCVSEKYKRLYRLDPVARKRREAAAKRVRETLRYRDAVLNGTLESAEAVS